MEFSLWFARFSELISFLEVSNLMPICQILPAPNPVLVRGNTFELSINICEGRHWKDSASWVFPQEQPNYISYLIFCNSKCKLEEASRFYESVCPCFSDIMINHAEVMEDSTSLHRLSFLTFCRKCMGHMAFERRIQCILN